MRKVGFLLLAICLCLCNVASALPAQWAFRVTFANKNGTQNINNPLAFLSQRALDRRHAQDIQIDSLDLPVSPAYVDSVLTLTGGVLHLTSRWLNECVVLLDDSSQIANLQGKPYISSVAWVAYYASGLHNKVKPHSKFDEERALTSGPMPLAKGTKATGDPNYYDLTWNQTHMVNGDCEHDLGYKGDGKLIAVLDVGFQEVDSHPGFDSLRLQGRLIDTFNFVMRNTSVYNSDYHGTSCLSTIAGNIPDSFIGSAPHAQIALFLTEDVASEQPIELDNLIAGAERADSIGADVVTASLGYNKFDAPLDGSNYSYPDMTGHSTIAARGANIAVSKGMVFLVAAGNEGANAWHYITTPADADSVFTVGAVTPVGNPAGFSSYGPNYSGLIKPDVSAQGAPAAIFSPGHNISTGNGTSFATPQMAGWVACLLQQAPTAKPWSVKRALDSTADHHLNPTAQLGYGIPDICAAGNVLVDINTVPEQWAFRVSFPNKNGYNLAAPLTFLSQRAINRRNTQSIAIDSTDLPVSSAYVDSVVRLTGGVLHVTSRWMNDCVVLLSDSAMIQNLQGKPFVTGTQYIAHYGNGLHFKPARNSETMNEAANAQAQKGTGDPAYYGSTWSQTHMLNGDCLHDLGFKGQSKIIAVLDQGFKEVDTHPGLDSMRASGRLLQTHDFVLNKNTVFGTSIHGTCALSTMAGLMPNSYVGAAPKASYVLYITEDTHSEQPIEMDNLLAAAERADSLGADVITCSLGYSTFADFPSASFSFTDLDGKTTLAAKTANTATKKGMLFVASAGNEGQNAWNKILTPGDADSALTIGSVTPTQAIAPASGFGPNAAGHIKPDVCAQGEPASVLYTGGTISNQGGTSFATPQLAGWAACLWQMLPSATPFMLRDAINKSADHFTNPANQSGYGIPDLCVAKSVLLSVSDKQPAQQWASVYPTFFRTATEVNIVFANASARAVSCFVTSIDGREIASFTKVMTAASQRIIWNAPADLPCGVYILKATSGGQHFETKLVKY